MRGEHQPSCLLTNPQAGSSPHARGTQRHSTQSVRKQRFIPACAGNTEDICIYCRLLYGSSPHARGTRDSLNQDRFSSAVHPRMRGEHVKSAASSFYDSRFIPACAGNTLSVVASGGTGMVHPRMRGEHQPSVLSSNYQRRFIPACAGNTKTGCGTSITSGGSSPHARGTRIPPNNSPSAAPVHPRMRGEHLPENTHAVYNWRFIPACAGNTIL